MKVLGSLRIIVLAKERGLIPFARPVLEKLRGSGAYVSDELIDRAIALAGESWREGERSAYASNSRPRTFATNCAPAVPAATVWRTRSFTSCTFPDFAAAAIVVRYAAHTSSPVTS